MLARAIAPYPPILTKNFHPGCSLADLLAGISLTKQDRWLQAAHYRRFFTPQPQQDDRFAPATRAASQNGKLGRAVDRTWDQPLPRSRTACYSPLSLVYREPTMSLPLTLENVETTLDELRPYLISDGGNVELVEIDGPVVKLRLQGACGSCPSSAMTLRMGIERRLKEMIPEIAEVEQVA